MMGLDHAGFPVIQCGGFFVQHLWWAIIGCEYLSKVALLKVGLQMNEKDEGKHAVPGA